MTNVIKKAFAIILATALLATNVYSNEQTKPAVDIRIESFDKTLAKDEFQAYTVKEALDHLDKVNNLNIIYNHANENVEVISINSVANHHFEDSGKWLCYIVRDEETMKLEDYLGFRLYDSDEIVIYYGDEKTLIPSIFEITLFNDEVSDKAEFLIMTEKNISDETEMFEKIGIDGVNIYVEQPRGYRNIATTNENGITFIYPSDVGMYKYYAEKYTENVPEMVKTDENSFFYGIQNENEVSRIEALSFINSLFDLQEQNQIEDLYFLDVDETHKLFKNVIIGKENGIVSGYGDGNFSPDSPITLLELIIMLAQIPEITSDNTIDIEIDLSAEVPQWAFEHVLKILSNAQFSTVFDYPNLDFGTTVTKKTLEQIYHENNETNHILEATNLENAAEEILL